MSTSPFGYFLRQRENGEFKRFSFGTSLHNLKQQIDSHGSGDASTQQQDAADGRAEGSDGPLATLLDEIVSTGLSQSDLIWVSAAARSLFFNSFVDSVIIKSVSRDCKVIEDTDEYVIWELDEAQYFELADKKDQLDQLRRGLAALPSASLMSIVSSFDSSIVDVVRSMFRLKPELFKDTARSLDAKTILSASSLDSLQTQLIDDEAYRFSRGSHDEQTAYIEKTFHIDTRKHWKRWPDFIEIFERRNLIAHGERLFNQRYASICKQHGHSGSDKLVGQAIELRQSYLSQSSDVLLEYSVLLVFSLWRKHFSDTEAQAFAQLNETIFNLIIRGRYSLASRLSEYGLSIKSSAATDAIRRMLVVNNASAYRHDKNQEKSNKVLDAEDWSASSDVFKICVAALRDDATEVARLLPMFSTSDAIPKNAFRTWPVFKFIQDQKAYQDKFAEVFGEPLLRQKAEPKELEDLNGSTPQGVAEEQTSESADNSATDETVH